MTEPMTIEPYWSEDLHTWVFDDAAVDLAQEPFVKGADKILSELVQDIPNARDGVRASFSDQPFPGFQRSLTLIREEDGGAWYGLDDSTLEGWLCPMLFRYFSTTPEKLYVRVEPI